MADSRFHKKNGVFKISLLAEISGCRLVNNSSEDIIISDVSALSMAKEGDITFLQNPKYADELTKTKASACILSEKNISKAPTNMALLVSENPYYSYAVIASKFYNKENKFLDISELAFVESSADIGEGTTIKAGVYIGEGCKIGRNCTINSNVNITNAIIGDNVIIHNGTSIGQDGFGYAFHNGKHIKVPQLGRVLIENDVEIGANTTIDRGANPDTIIGEGTKIDNLVQIGHNVKIGKHCIIVSQVGISGSTEIGDYVIIGGQAGIAGHLKIGSQAQIGAQAGISRDVEPKAKVSGTPAVPVNQYHRQTIILDKLANPKKT
ncbi:MAG: UDP-3-O-(3-hydroxymyristoyl)glucosamine N-acyltransferase [Rickettsiales bacterium]|nr:UDP-3-O-(3-hydroxymyristoyl)glucosamine N-acyltransferase [Rickettsiales bacterium]